MGSQASSGLSDDMGERRGHLSPEDYQRFEQLWNDCAAQGSESDRLNMVSFVKHFKMCDSQISELIFQILSLNNSFIEKHFMESRIGDIKSQARSDHPQSFVVAPWSTLVEAINLTVIDVLQIVLRSPNPVKYESDSLEALIDRFPWVESQFNRSVIDFMFHNEQWSKPTLGTPGLFDRLSQHVLQLLIPTVELSSGTLLFSLAQNGASFRAFGSAIKYYPGEIVCIIRDVAGRTFGFYSRRNIWTETAYEPESFDQAARETIIFQTQPEIRTRRVNQRGGSNCVYLNISNSNHPVGIGLGGRERSFRLWINGDNITSIYSMESDATYESGQVLSSHEAKETLIETTARALEVYGFSGNVGIEQQRNRKIADTEIRNDRKRIDRMKFAQNDFDREMFLGKTFQQGRTGQDRQGS
jgi:hypothetical protein